MIKNLESKLNIWNNTRNKIFSNLLDILDISTPLDYINEVKANTEQKSILVRMYSDCVRFCDNSLIDAMPSKQNSFIKLRNQLNYFGWDFSNNDALKINQPKEIIFRVVNSREEFQSNFNDNLTDLQ